MMSFVSADTGSDEKSIRNEQNPPSSKDNSDPMMRGIFNCLLLSHWQYFMKRLYNEQIKISNNDQSCQKQ